MASTATRSRLFAATAGRAYRLEMEGRTLLVLLGLLSLTGVVVFYLGVVTGMGLRDPNQALPVAQQAAPGTEGQQLDADQLAFFRSLTTDKPAVEGLGSPAVQDPQVSSQTQELIARARQEMALEEVTPAPAVQAPRAATRPAPPSTPASRAVAAPKVDAPLTAAAGGDLFTVQVFSSQNQQKAQALVTRLKGQGFPAYLHLYQASDNQTWYRVRVGKTSKGEAEQLSARLKKDAKINNTQVLGL